MDGGISLSGLAGWAALIAFFAFLAITNFADLWWVTWPITLILIGVTSIGILKHGFGGG
jgi:hypothetical protein